MVSDVLTAARELAAAGGRGALVTIVGGDRVGARWLVDAAGSVVAGDDLELLITGLTAEVVRRIATETPGVISIGAAEWFVDVIAPPPALRLFGAGPIAEALCRLAAGAGYAVHVGDPRPAHTLTERYPDAVTVSCGWPEDLVAAHPLDGATYVVSLLHVERYEDPLLRLALAAGVRYIGALGSRKTHAARLERLRAAGYSAEELAEIHGPVGLAIGAVTPEEIAVAILAEMVQVRRKSRVES